MNRQLFFPLIVVLLTVSAEVCLADTPTLAEVRHEYQFDDGSGTIAVDSVGGNHAALHNFGVGNTQWIPGTFGSGVNYADENAYVITDSPSSVGSASQFSVSFWSRLNSRPNLNDSILATPLTANWITYNPTGNTNSLDKRGIGIGSIRDPDEPQLGVWEHYVISYDRATNYVSVYRDGMQRDAGEFILPSLNTRWVFGHNQGLDNTNGSWHGALDEIQFYDRVLTLAEAQQLSAVMYPQGDYNRNGTVDAADYVVWRNQLGQTVPKCSGADANCNTVIENLEYNTWRRNFGRTGSTVGAIAAGNEYGDSAANVPEPTSFLSNLSIVAIAVSVMRKR